MDYFYIDADFKCHASNPDGLYRKIEKPIFLGKCDAFIEGYRYIPIGEIWEREDGRKFLGEMYTPWVDFDELCVIQNEYNYNKLKDAENALEILLGGETE